MRVDYLRVLETDVCPDDTRYEYPWPSEYITRGLGEGKHSDISSRKPTL